MPRRHWIFFVPLFFVGLSNCDNPRKGINKKVLLAADRKAPLGWVYLDIYEDSTFEFILTGLRDRAVYPGTVSLRHDTLLFKYSD